MTYESTGEIRIPQRGEFYLYINKRKENWKHPKHHEYGKRQKFGNSIRQMWCCDECSPDWGTVQIIMRKYKI